MISKRLEVKAGRKDIRAPHLGQIVIAVAGGKDARHPRPPARPNRKPERTTELDDFPGMAEILSR